MFDVYHWHIRQRFRYWNFYLAQQLLGYLTQPLIFTVCYIIAKNTSMHTSTNFFLFSLAIADITILFVGKFYKFLAPKLKKKNGKKRYKNWDFFGRIFKHCKDDWLQFCLRKRKFSCLKVLFKHFVISQICLINLGVPEWAGA